MISFLDHIGYINQGMPVQGNWKDHVARKVIQTQIMKALSNICRDAKIHAKCEKTQ
jgi:hypothetical protein